MKTRYSNPFRSIAPIASALTVAWLIQVTTPTASAVTSTWTGISGNWSDTTVVGGVWTAGIPADGTGFTANFTGVDIAADRIITLDSARTIGNITFTDATTASNNLLISGANILTLDVASGAPVMNITNQTLTISSEIQGSEGLTKSGAGDLVLSGTNPLFSGPVSINAGVLTLTNISALGTASGITMANGSDLRLNGVALGTFDYDYPISLTSGTATIKSFQGITETFNLGGAISGLGGLTFANESSGSATLNFVVEQPNTYRGNTTITAAAGGNITLKLGANDALPTTTTLTINQGSGSNGTNRTSALDLGGFNQTIAGLISADIFQFENSVVRNTVGAATLTINNNSGTSRNFTGKIQQTGAGVTLNLVKTGGNAQVLAANNNYTGTTTVNVGGLTLDFAQFGSSSTNAPADYIDAASVLELGGGTFTVIGRANGSTVASTGWTGGGTTRPDITFATLPPGIVVGQAITGTGIGTATFIVSIDTTAKKVSLNQLMTAATGTLAAVATTVATSQTVASTTLNAGRSGLTINANSGNGTLLALNALTRNVGGTVNFTQPAGTISATNGFTTSTANTAGTILGGWATVGGLNWATNNGTNVVALGSYTTTTVAGTTAGSYTGADIDVDSSAGLLDGVITPNSLRFNAAAATTVTLATGNNTITSGGILVSATVGANASIITGGTLRGASGSDLVVNQFNGTTSLTIESVIDDNTTATALTKSGSGALVLSGANLYTGNTYLNEGNLLVSAANNLGAAASNLVFNGGTLQITGTALTSLSSLGRTISVTPGKVVGLSIADATNTFTVEQILNQSTGGFTKGGVGTVIINQANTYSGTTTIFNGKLILSGPGNLGAVGNLTLSGGQLDLGGSSQTVGAVSVSAAYASGETILNGSLTGTSYAASNATGNAIISANLLANGPIGFTKSGAGTTTLSGTNTYTGTTAVSGGVLKIGSAGALGGGNLTLSGSGVLGLTANFTRADGTGAGQFQWTGSGGFAAYGAERTVSTGSAISWASASLSGYTLVLGAADADATLIWSSGISLAGGSRTIQVNDGSAAVDARISGTLSGGGTFNKTGTGTLALTATTNSFTGNVVINGGTLQFGNAGTTGNFTAITGTSIAITSGTLAVNRTNAFTQATDLNGKIISGAGSFRQSGSGTTTLSLTNTYTGATTINAGTLALGANDALPNAVTSTVSIGNATLNAATFTDTVGTLDVTSTAKINLGAGAALAFADSSAVDWTDTDPDGTLNITGTFVPGDGTAPGTNPGSLRFGTTNAGLTPAQLLLISKTGFTGFGLDANGYLTATGAGGYSSWQAAQNGGTGTTQAIDLDHDLDGVSNGAEYFLGGTTDTTGFTALPGVTNTAGILSVTWTKGATYTGTYGIDFWVETSATLSGAWATETSGVNVTFPSATEVKYTFPAGTTNFARLKVTGP